ncbi:MAG: cytochrome-c oxidase, cbb3-type subunit III [Nitrospinota bacterium]
MSWKSTGSSRFTKTAKERSGKPMEQGNNVEKKEERKSHIWDTDLYELNNPIPTWWVRGYYLSIIFAVAYCVVYPSWPGEGDTVLARGIFGWSSTGQFQAELKTAEKKREIFFKEIRAKSLEEIFNDKALEPFVHSVGKSIFLTRCSRCHGKGGQGQLGKFPSLVDDESIHRETLPELYKIIKKGKINKMPKHIKKLTKKEIEEVAEFVYSLSHTDFDEELAKRGREVFDDDDPECYFCHGDNATGDHKGGGPDLTDHIWLYGGDRKTLIETITYGRTGVMPGWGNELSDEQIKTVAVYVKKLSQ